MRKMFVPEQFGSGSSRQMFQEEITGKKGKGIVGVVLLKKVPDIRSFG